MAVSYSGQMGDSSRCVGVPWKSLVSVYPQYLERKLHAHVYVYQYAHIGRVHIDIHKRVYAPIHVVYV